MLSNSLVVWTVDDDDDFARSNLLRDFDDDTEDFRCFREENNEGKREEEEEEADVTVGVLVLFACKKSDLVSILCDVSEESRFYLREIFVKVAGDDAICVLMISIHKPF